MGHDVFLERLSMPQADFALRMLSAFPTAPCAAGGGAVVVMRATTGILSQRPFAALRGHLDAARQHLAAFQSDVNAMSQHFDALEQMLGLERDAPG
jgi:hypothetical protein